MAIKKWEQKVRGVLASKWFLSVVLALFVLQASWIALSAAYPQAFDEDFHFGIIQVYSHHWLPFLTGNWPNAAPFGSISRDPSFLYHYAMSFPYRLIAHFTHNQTAQIIILRLINVALFTCGLVLFKRVLRRAGLSDAAANASIFIMAFIPVAPLLAGQINYDNLLLPLTAWACLLTFNIIDQLQERRLTIQALLGLLTVCLAASMVKYEFLPIFLGIVIFLAVFAWRRLNGHWPTTFRQTLKLWGAGNAAKWLLAVAFLATFCLFAQRDLGNIVKYHTVVPDCSQVLKIQQCSAYSVWIHDYQSHQAVVAQTVHVDNNPLAYLGNWVYWLWYRLFFAISGPTHGFQNFPPLPLPAAAFALLLITSVVAMIMRGREVLAGRLYLKALSLIVAIYLLTLLGAGVLKYRKTDVLELMNGRYLFPVLLPAAAVVIPAIKALTHAMPHKARLIAAVFVLICFLDGGGVLTFISRSNPTWYWSNRAVQRMNDDAKTVLEPVVFDGPRGYSTGMWFFN